MIAEHVFVNADESLFGEQQLLQSQIELLQSAQHLNEYKKLRAEEMVLKVALKTKVDEVKEALAKLEKVLPKSNYQIPVEEPEVKAEKTPKEVKDHQRKTLDDEIEEIRRKLLRLRGAA